MTVEAARATAPVSYLQETLWLLERVCRETGPAYNEPLAFRIVGVLRVDLLRRALELVVERHESLRTTFVETAAGLRAVVLDKPGDLVQEVDLRHLGAEDAARRAGELTFESYSRPFDLAVDPLLRAIVVRIADGEHVFGLTVHHIVTDGWSMGIVLDEIHRQYVSLCRSGEPADLPELPVQYGDYALELRDAYEQGALDASIEYWKHALEGAPALLELPLDRPRPAVQTFRGSTCSIRIPRSMVDELVDVCRRRCGSTEFVVLLAAYAVLLGRHAGQDAVAIGTPLRNRDRSDLLDVVGCFVNTAAFVLALDDDLTFRELLVRVRELSIEMLEHQAAPYPKVLECLGIERNPSWNPVFQAMLTSAGRKPTLDLGVGLDCRPFPVRRVGAKFDLLVHVFDLGEELELLAEFNADLFDPETIERLLRRYARLLERLALDVDAKVSRVSILPDEERRLILDVWNDTRVEYPRTTVVDVFEAQAAETPDAIAVEFEGRSLTYRELNRLANRLARLLLERRERASEFVGVYMERSLELVVALVSVVKAGLAYVPIDPDYPAARVRYMIEDSGVPLVLTQERHRAALAGVDAEVVVPPALEPSEGDEANVSRDLSPDSPVYMIYTSGSTGRPKGVVNRHEALLNRLYWMQSTYGLTAEDRVLQKTPFSFDVSVWEFFWPLMFGARIVVARPGGHRDPDYLKRVVCSERITTLHFVPSMLDVFLEEDDLASWCGTLRRVFCSGEALLFATVERFYSQIDCELHNLYGPTEAAIDVSYWPCSLDYPGQVVPIGKPVANTRLYVLDDHMQLQPIGVPGELCIGGVQLARGYHGRDDLTRKAFVPDPYAGEQGARLYRTGDLARYLPDGQIQYLGRLDDQIKLRGFRIELGEVEAVVRSLPGVREAAVVLHEGNAHPMLVAYVVADDFDPQRAKDQLGEQLPDFMVPQAFVEIPRVPTSANGKLDRKALPTPLAVVDAPAAEAPPATEEERALAGIWRGVLGAERVDLDSNFFRLGGDSILSIRVAARLRELGYDVEVHEVLANPTIRQLGRKLRKATLVGEGPATPFALLDAEDRRALAADVEDAWPLTMLQAGMIYHSMREEGSPVYHDVFAFDVEAPVDVERLLAALRAVQARHPQLRSAFDLTAFSRPLQLVYREVGLPVSVVDLTWLSRGRQDEVVDGWIEAEKERDFDLERAPLFRVQVHVRSEDELNLAISFHHAILDGWSVALLLEEVRGLYADLLEGWSGALELEPVPYSAYVELEREALQDPAHADFWLSRLEGAPDPALARPQAGGPAAPVWVERALPDELVAPLEARARELGLPAKSVFLALHLHALSEIARSPEVVTGLVVNGRPEVAGGEELAGLFLNTLPFPIRLSGESWPSLAARVLELEQEALPHRRLPLAEIRKRSGRKELFDVVFNYTDFHVYGQGESPVAIRGARYFEQTSFPAVVHVHRDSFARRMRLVVTYDAARLDGDLVERYLDSFLTAAADAAPSGPGGSEPTALERQIAEIVSQALGLDDLGLDDDYVELGLDSIVAIRVVAKLKRLGLKPAIEDVFERPTVRALAERAAGTEGAEAAAEPVRPFELARTEDGPFPPAVVDAYPATEMQLHMLRRSRVYVEQAVYHDVFSYRLALPLDEALLRDVLERLVNGHETFRTAFDLDGRSVPMQLVFSTVRPQLEVVEASSEASFRDWFEREKRHGFDWSRPGLIRFYVHRLGASDLRLTLSFHHAIVDGWSLSLFVRQLVRVYVAALESGEVRTPPPPTLKYRDYVRVELESRSSEELRSFWSRELRGCRPASLPRLDIGGHASRWSEAKLVLDRGLHEDLASLSSRLGVPLKHTLLAGHLAVIGLVCGETDVLTGVFANGRLEEEEGDDVLGMFLNVVPFRQELDGRTWRGLVEETAASDRRRLPYRRYALPCIEHDLGRERILETAFNYTRFPAYRDVAALRDVRWFEHTDFSLLANVGHDLRAERLVVTLGADGRVLSQPLVETLARLYEVVFALMTRDEDSEVVDASDEVEKLLRELSSPLAVPASR